MIEKKFQGTEKKEKIEMCIYKLYEASGRKDDPFKNQINQVRDCRRCNGYNDKCKSYDPRR